MKTLLVLMTILAIGVCIVGPVFAVNGGFSDAWEWCKAHDNLGYKNTGMCVRYVVVCYGPGNTGPVCACEDYQNVDPVGFYDMYNNLGDCVSHLRHEVVGNN